MSKISTPLFALAGLSLMGQTPTGPSIETVQGPGIRIVYRGSKGFDGLAGSRGSTGMSGAFGSIDFHHPKAGGRGGAGGRGQAGGNGYPGGSGPNLSVTVAFQEESGPRLLVTVGAQNEVRKFLLDPAHATLTLRTEGGPGGRGGRGGPGGRGGSGGSGTPSGMGGSDGMQGMDGMNGPGGPGGAITVSVDPRARPYLAAIHFENPGGVAPVIQDVATTQP